MTEAQASPSRTHAIFSPTRIWALARVTFTQLVRMKVFYFMLIFCAVVIGATFIFLEYSFEEELKLIKDVSLGAMQLFATIFAIVGTALLLPRDLEDRTLYTILCKPVPRLEYLLGKLLGVLLLIAISLVLMDVLFTAVLFAKQSAIAARTEEALALKGASELEIARTLEIIAKQGVTWNLLNGVAAIFMKSCVAAAVALMVSTFASSTLFTIIVSFVVYFVGHIQALARDFWLGGMITDTVERLIAVVVSLLFPDFQLFNIVDGVVAGEPVPLLTMAKLAGLTLVYLAVYNFAAFFVFADKEL
ncbi:MAG: hypothetical protein R3F11_29950 [Verrucomicrobiales bacterium]